MKVFISWSGEKSKAVAELFGWWLRCILQSVDTFISSKDIDRGTLWFSEIYSKLKDTNFGIICITRENKNKPWILFEAGSLAKGMSSSKVCTFLVDLEAAEIEPPLSQFNHTFNRKDSVYELVLTLNASLEDKALPSDVVDKTFERFWPDFEKEIKAALLIDDHSKATPERSEESILYEVLNSVRGLDRRIRGLESNHASMRRELRERTRQSSRDMLVNSLSSEELHTLFPPVGSAAYNEIARQIDPSSSREMAKKLFLHPSNGVEENSEE